MKKLIEEGRINFSGHIDLEIEDGQEKDEIQRGKLKKPIAVKINK